VTPLLAILVAYSFGLIATGAWIGRSVRQTGDYFVGGRSLGAGLIFATVLAPNIGAGSTVGATSIAYREGLSAWWWCGSAGLGSLVLAFWVGPRIWREAKERNFLTVGDFLESHFGLGVRGLAALLIWFGTLAILCAQLDGAAVVLGRAAGIPHVWGCLISVGVMTTYFVAGGLAGAARVNGIQLFVKLVGFSLAAPLAIVAAGGWHAVETLNATHMSFLRGTSPIEGWPRIFLLGPAFFLSPGLIQKAYAARDERALTRGVAWNGVVLILFAMIPVTLGLAARAMFPDLANPDEALPDVLGRLPLAVGGLALAAVFSAEMSAADAVLFMLSTSGGRDLYKGFIRRDASDAEVLRAARVMAIAGGALGFALTFVLPTVVDALRMFYSVLVVSLFAPILGGLFLPQGGRWGALAAMVVGVSVLAATSIVTGGAGYGWATPAFLGLVSSAATYAVLAVV
jgi:solute:Na+ symporter, SSS family